MTSIPSYCPLCISLCGCFYKVDGEATEMAANYTALAGPECDPVSGSALLRGICCRLEKTLLP